jgi:hypothetical protein
MRKIHLIMILTNRSNMWSIIMVCRRAQHRIYYTVKLFLLLMQLIFSSVIMEKICVHWVDTKCMLKLRLPSSSCARGGHTIRGIHHNVENHILLTQSALSSTKQQKQV